MKFLSIKEAKNRLTELARVVEAGETITVTRHGKPVFDIVPHQKKRGFDSDRARGWLEARGYGTSDWYVAPDFDDPLPDSFWFPDEANTK
jgi:prevent-host-death family protein